MLPYVKRGQKPAKHKSSPFLTTELAAVIGGEYWYEELVLRIGEKTQLPPECVSWQNKSYTLIDCHRDWKNLLLEDSVCIIEKKNLLIALHKEGPQSFFDKQTIAAFSLPENQKKGKPVVVVDPVNVRFFLQGEEELRQNYETLAELPNATLMQKGPKEILFWVYCTGAPIMYYDDGICFAKLGGFIDITEKNAPKFVKREVLHNFFDGLDIYRLPPTACQEDLEKTLMEASRITALADYHVIETSRKASLPGIKFPKHIADALNAKPDFPKFFP